MVQSSTAMTSAGHDTHPILESLDRWEQSYNGESSAYFVYSDSYDTFETSKWAEYADLDTSRKAASLPQRDWQPSQELMRDDRQLMRPRRGRPFDSADPHAPCPLGICLDRGSAFDDRSRQYPWRRLLSSWASFRARYAASPEFSRNLSAPQLDSYTVLSNWWEASYCDRVWPARARSWIEQQLHDRYPPVLCSEQAMSRLNSALGDGPPPYAARCLSLLVMEFHPGAWEPYAYAANMRILEAMRSQTAACAIAQRLAFSDAPGPVSPSHPPPGRVGYPSMPLVNHYHERHALPAGQPYYLWDTRDRKTIEVRSLEGARCPEYVCISHTWGRWVDRSKAPFAIPGVPWPVPRVKPERFLVENVPEELAKLGYPYVWMDLFCIPQEPKGEWRQRHDAQLLKTWHDRADSEIARQAAIFQSSQRCVAWLNDLDAWADVKLAISWCSMQFLAESRISDPAASNDARGSSKQERRRHVPDAGWGSDLPGKLVNRPIDEEDCTLDSRPGRPALRWFSSLWTLQEALLCPDMDLCCRDWSRLTDQWGHTITLKTLMVFLGQCSREIGKANLRDGVPSGFAPRPAGPSELLDLRNITKMETIFLDNSPMMVISMTSLRQCSGSSRSRAPAIMSALCVTDWYLSRDTPVANPFGEEEIPSQLVWDMYPLGFLQEASRKIGAAFYYPQWTRLQLNGKRRQVLKQRTALGSLLPFETAGRGPETGQFPAANDTTDHPAVSSWHIRADGSVRIPRAPIIADSRHGDGHTQQPSMMMMKADVRWSMQGDLERDEAPSGTTPDRHGSMQDLGAVLETIAGSGGRAYAVVLCAEASAGLYFGILLFELDDGEPRTRYLIKVGTFTLWWWAVDSSISWAINGMPEETKVDWVVL